MSLNPQQDIFQDYETMMDEDIVQFARQVARLL